MARLPREKNFYAKLEKIQTSKFYRAENIHLHRIKQLHNNNADKWGAKIEKQNTLFGVTFYVTLYLLHLNRQIL